MIFIATVHGYEAELDKKLIRERCIDLKVICVAIMEIIIIFYIEHVINNGGVYTCCAKQNRLLLSQ